MADCFCAVKIALLDRAVVSGGAGGVLLTLFQPEGADYANPIIASTPRFQNLTTALYRKGHP